MKVRELKKKSSPRINTVYLQSFNIQAYGNDNLYPQTLRDIISASPTGSECSDRYASFIEGDGFNNLSFSEAVVNRRGDTADDIHTLVCKDIALYNGFALHVNYNVMGQIVELQHIPFENCRLLEPDSTGYVAKIAIHPDWTGRKTRAGRSIRVEKSNVDYIDIFNPLKEVVQAQIEASGGIESYKGQVLWVSMAGKGTYPAGKADSVATDMSTDEGLSNIKYRNARHNFMPAGLFITKEGQQAQNDDDEGFSDTLYKLQGDINVGKIMEVSVGSDEEKPEFVSLETKNYDKDFTVTEASTTERIYSAYGQEPWYCIRVGKIGFSGDILSDAFEYYNSIVSKQQRTIERTFKRVFSYWFETINISGDYSVKPLKYVANGTIDNSKGGV